RDGKMIHEEQFPVIGATISGNITLPDTLSRGNYWIRAFTPWMLNSDEDCIFHRAVYVINSSTPKSKTVSTIQNDHVNLQFFPESGNMVAGLNSTSAFAFRAVNDNGLPVNLKGSIVVDDGSTITSFKTYHNGMGKVNFKPLAGKKYSAEILVNGK